MFTHIVSQLSGRITALFTQALASLKALLCKLVSSLHVSITQAYQNADNLLRLRLQLALTTLKSNPLVVGLTKAVQSIKVAHTSVKASLTQIGSLLQTIVQTIRPPAPTVSSPKKGKPVGVTKSARSRTKKNKTAPTPTEVQSTQDGLKLLGHAKQLLQRVSQLWKAKP
jgi:hypothetical protein